METGSALSDSTSQYPKALQNRPSGRANSWMSGAWMPRRGLGLPFASVDDPLWGPEEPEVVVGTNA